MKRSVKKKIAFAYIGTMAAALLITGLVHYLFLGSFYSSRKVRILGSSFRTVNEIAPDSAEAVPDAFESFCSANNLTVLLISGEFSRIVYSNAPDRQSLQTLLFGLVNGNEQENTEVLKETERYQIQRFHDRYLGGDYLQLIGWLDDGKIYLARSPLESIHVAVDISNTFYLYTGLVMMLLGGIVSWQISKKIVQPIQELTSISKRMTELDFEARYQSGGEDEIGELGEHFNIMSARLEQAIADLKSANVELTKDIEKKQQIDEMRREFLSNVTHELKTPIALIQGYAEGLRDNISEDAESREFYCDVIIDEASRMNEMVKKLLNLNQLEFGEDKVTIERFDLAQVIRGVLQSSSILTEQKGAEILFAQEEPVYVWGDEFKVEEIITNYLTNALNHLDYERRIEIACRHEDGRVVTSVFNTGDPIPEEELDKIWIKFYKVDKARTRAYGGSGIGLAIVKAITDSLHQSCGCRNFDNGVSFWFTLDADDGKDTAYREQTGEKRPI